MPSMVAGDTDFLSPLHFSAVFSRMPTVAFMCTDVDIPGISMPSVDSPTPFNPIHNPADKLLFDELSIRFKVDSQMANWAELFDWINQIGFPASFKQRAVLESAPEDIAPVRSVLSIILQDSKKNPSVRFDFVDVLPTKLGAIQLSVQPQKVEYATCIAEFVYRQYTMTTLSDGVTHPTPSM